MLRHGYIEETIGLGQPETTPGKIGVLVAQAVLGAAAASAVSPKDWKTLAPYGGIAAIAACHLVETILPMTGVLYWARSVVMIPGGVGALIGMYQLKQMQKSGVSAQDTLVGYADL